MKRILLTSVLAVLVAFGTTVMAQEYPDEYLGLPGDNLNLYAVMKLFQESATIEAFERNLNDETNKINNLDLNNDSFVDYITVNDYVDGDVHTIVLRVALDRNEFQDVAVFTVQKFRDGSVQIQLIGDEALYGKNYIIEPYYAETPNPGYMGKNSRNVTVNVIYTSPYEVAGWPLVRFIYLPDYRVWRSSWYWGYYPVYWHPWRPYFWHYYYGYHYNWYYDYYRHYHHWHHPRWQGYHSFYYAGHHSHSPQVHEYINKGTYNGTYSHPEQRRDGEVLFTSLNPNRERRTAENTPVVSQRRSTSDQVNRSQSTERTTTSEGRRSDNAATVRNSSDPSSNRNTGEVRRSTTTDNERPASRSSDEPRTGETRRSSSVSVERPVNKSSSGQNTSETRRPSSVNEKPASRPSSDQSVAEPKRPSTYVNEKPTVRASETRRNSEPVKREEPSRVSQPAKSQTERKAPAQTKSQSSERKTEKTRKTEESKNPRR